ncbi:39S ribosomal protein L22, mitochondrial isoform X1 [Triplophysa rosa]|uniref:Large ribosomal subunit protein uL22m n=1 Tax=Triplophysa rosa TaxID=992332 RepID=A0A9W7WE90_TRIRA|nr:39S ribosomal protein L22, mitochondrial isoform X1 [Triplophysa rosa]KAI7795975.1 39S ribosomal protein L22 [Triplophysa rosa]
MAASAVTWAGLSAFKRLCGQINSRLLGASSQVSCLHTSTQLNSKHWERYNRIVHPPQQKDEPRRPAEIYHSRRQIKYSKDKMWYLAKLIKGMTIDQALAQLEFSDKKGAKIIKEVILEAQEMAVKNHNVEYKSNLYLADSFSGKGKYLKRIRYHGRGMFGIMDKVNCHYFVKLVEGVPPKVEQKTGFDQAKDYVEELKNRTVIYSL